MTTVVTPPSNQVVVDIPVSAQNRTALTFFAEDAAHNSSGENEDCYPFKRLTCIPDLEFKIDFGPLHTRYFTDTLRRYEAKPQDPPR